MQRLKAFFFIVEVNNNNSLYYFFLVITLWGKKYMELLLFILILLLKIKLLLTPWHMYPLQTITISKLDKQYKLYIHSKYVKFH
jgi:hypothetical protein